jgi:2',3'-cyclic-nucleotide 2'-phosphodiesterase (5'-nucleotidase family)
VEKMRREKQPILVVDSGDLFFNFTANTDSERALKKARLISRAYRRMEVAAVNVGDLDLLQGIDSLRREYSQGLPLISANLLDPSKKTPIFPPYVIREISGLRIALFGLLPPESGPEIGAALRSMNEGKIWIQDPVEAARETLQKLRGKADLVILLSDLGLHKDQMVAKEAPGIHFILGGHEGRFFRQSNQAEKTHIFQSGNKGMNVGALRVHVENPASPYQDRGRTHRLQERINALGLRLLSLRKARESQSGKNLENIDRTIQEIQRQRAILEEELKNSLGSYDRGNRFQFTLESMEMHLPENETVRKWISEEGMEKD